MAQRCDFCHNPVAEDVETVLYADVYGMACSVCRQYFPERIKVYWGVEAFKFYWSLGPSRIKYKRSKYRGKRLCFRLSKSQVAHLRALGYTVKKVGGKRWIQHR